MICPQIHSFYLNFHSTIWAHSESFLFVTVFFSSIISIWLFFIIYISFWDFILFTFISREFLTALKHYFLNLNFNIWFLLILASVCVIFVGTCFGQRQETPTVLYLGYMGINKKPRELVFMSLRLGVHLFSTLRVFLYSLVVLLPWFCSCKGRDLIKIWLLYTGRIKSLG